jgi:hypothetical protein
MSPPIENNVDWTVPATPGGDRVGPSLTRPKQAQTPVATKPKRSVMDTLLGENNLSAADTSGNDPYNATGRQFRR